MMHPLLTTLDVFVLIVGRFVTSSSHNSAKGRTSSYSQVCGQLLSVNILSDADVQILPQAGDGQRRGGDWDSEKVKILLGSFASSLLKCVNIGRTTNQPQPMEDINQIQMCHTGITVKIHLRRW